MNRPNDRMRAVLARRSPDWYRVQASAEADSAEVYIYAEIGESWWGDTVAANGFVQELAALEVGKITVHINSPGGDPWDGIAIANALRSHKAAVTTIVDGLAASAASLIAIAGDEVVMAKGAQMMIHEGSGLVFGRAQDMRDTADLMDKINANMAGLYADKAGGAAADWLPIMNAETWYNADEAVAAGLADRIDDSKKSAENAKARFDLSIFAHAGRAEAPAPHIPNRPAAPPVRPTQPEGVDAMSDTLNSGLRSRLGIRADAELDEVGLLAALDEALAEQTETTPAPLPEGTVAISQSVLTELQAKAARGDEARAQQFTDQRDGLIKAALAAGQIKPTDVADWTAQLTAPDGSVNPIAAKLLGSLAKNTAVPVALNGYSSDPNEITVDIDAEAAAWLSVMGVGGGLNG